MRYATWFILFLFMAASCLDEPDCYSLNNNIIGISFKRMSTGGADTVYLQSVTTQTEGATVIFVEESQVSRVFGLPVNYFGDQTQFTFEDRNGNLSALTVTYKTQAQFVSEECGNRYVLTDLDATATGFDSVRVVNDVPGRPVTNGSNIEVFRCPDRALLRVRFAAAIVVKAVTVNGVDADMLLDETARREFRIPMDISASQSTVRFTFGDDTQRDLVVGYQRQQQTFFSICGEQTVLSNLQLISSTFTEVEVFNRAFLDPPRTNLEITF